MATIDPKTGKIVVPMTDPVVQDLNQNPLPLEQVEPTAPANVPMQDELLTDILTSGVGADKANSIIQKAAALGAPLSRFVQDPAALVSVYGDKSVNPFTSVPSFLNYVGQFAKGFNDETSDSELSPADQKSLAEARKIEAETEQIGKPKDEDKTKRAQFLQGMSEKFGNEDTIKTRNLVVDEANRAESFYAAGNVPENNLALLATYAHILNPYASRVSPDDTNGIINGLKSLGNRAGDIVKNAVEGKMQEEDRRQIMDAIRTSAKSYDDAFYNKTREYAKYYEAAGENITDYMDDNTFLNYMARYGSEEEKKAAREQLDIK